MKKIKSLFREKYHIIVLSLMFIAAFYVMTYVGFFVDDYTYRQVAVCRWPEIFQFLKWHIINFNGRTLVHFFVILFFRKTWTIELWRVLCTAAFCSVPLLCAAIVAEGKKLSRSAVLLTVFFMMSTYPYVWDSSVYWLSGSFNYLFPSVFLLITMLAAVKKPDSAWLVPLAFISGATTDQNGMMTIGFFLLFGIDRAINQKKISVKSIIFFIAACAGYAMIMICPGTYARLENQGGMSIKSFAYNLLKLIKIRWTDNLCIITLTAVITFFVLFWLFRFKNENKFTRFLNPVLAIPLAVLTVLNLMLKALLLAAKVIHREISFPDIINKILFAGWLVYVAILLGSLLLAGFYIYFYLKKPIPLISLILAYGSQFMMAAASLSMYRACIPALFTLYVFTSFSIVEFLNTERVKKIKHKTFFKICFIGLCVVFCAFQAVVGRHCVFKSDPYNPEPLTQSEMTEFTDKLERENKAYYSGNKWQEKIDLFDGAKLYF